MSDTLLRQILISYNMPLQFYNDICPLISINLSRYCLDVYYMCFMYVNKKGVIYLIIFILYQKFLFL